MDVLEQGTRAACTAAAHGLADTTPPVPQLWLPVKLTGS